MKNVVYQIEQTGGAWVLKYDSTFGYVYGFLKTGKKRMDANRQLCRWRANAANPSEIANDSQAIEMFKAKIVSQV